MKQIDRSMKRVEVQDWGVIPYGEGLRQQRELFEAAISLKERGELSRSVLVLCEHPPVFTMGKHGKSANLLMSKEYLNAQGIDYYEIDRGGDITFHGPGQIVGYPIFDLEALGIGLRQYVERLEACVIQVLASYGVEASRDPKATGVWIEPETPRARKICAIGIRSSRYVTMHGIALNVNTELRYFQMINPCGIQEKGVTSLAQELGQAVDFEQVKQRLAAAFLEQFEAE